MSPFGAAPLLYVAPVSPLQIRLGAELLSTWTFPPLSGFHCLFLILPPFPSSNFFPGPSQAPGFPHCVPVAAMSLVGLPPPLPIGQCPGPCQLIGVLTSEVPFFPLHVSVALTSAPPHAGLNQQPIPQSDIQGAYFLLKRCY